MLWSNVLISFVVDIIPYPDLGEKPVDPLCLRLVILT